MKGGRISQIAETFQDTSLLNEVGKFTVWVFLIAGGFHHASGIARYFPAFCVYIPRVTMKITFELVTRASSRDKICTILKKTLKK